MLMGRIYSCPEGKGTSTRGLQGPLLAHPAPPLATAPGLPYPFRIVRGFLYVLYRIINIQGIVRRDLRLIVLESLFADEITKAALSSVI